MYLLHPDLSLQLLPLLRLSELLLLVLGLNQPNIGFPPPPHVELVVAHPSWQPPLMRASSWRATW